MSVCSCSNRHQCAAQRPCVCLYLFFVGSGEVNSVGSSLAHVTTSTKVHENQISSLSVILQTDKQQ